MNTPPVIRYTEPDTLELIAFSDAHAAHSRLTLAQIAWQKLASRDLAFTGDGENDDADEVLRVSSIASGVSRTLPLDTILSIYVSSEEKMVLIDTNNQAIETIDQFGNVELSGQPLTKEDDYTHITEDPEFLRHAHSDAYNHMGWTVESTPNRSHAEHASLGTMSEDGDYTPLLTVLNQEHPLRQLS